MGKAKGDASGEDLATDVTFARALEIGRFTIAQVEAALASSAGVVTLASQKLKIRRETLHRWIKTDERLQAACFEARQVMLDLSEVGLFDLIRRKDREAIRFYLRCFGKERGYNDTYHVANAPGETFKTDGTMTVVMLPRNGREIDIEPEGENPVNE